MKMVANVKVQIFNDDNEQIVLENQEEIKTITDFGYKRFVLDKETTDYQVHLVKADLQFIYLFTDNPIIVKINADTAEPLEINDFYIFSTNDVDTLYLTNESTTLNAAIRIVEVKASV